MSRYVRVKPDVYSDFRGMAAMVNDIIGNDSNHLLLDVGFTRQIWFMANEVIEITEGEYMAEKAMTAFGLTAREAADLSLQQPYEETRK